MKKTAKRYTRFQLFLKKLIPSFIFSFIIVLSISVYITEKIAGGINGSTAANLESVNGKIKECAEKYNYESPKENAVFRNHLELLMGLYSNGNIEKSIFDIPEQQVFFMTDTNTKKIIAEPEKAIYLLDKNDDEKGITAVYKADESVFAKLTELREKYSQYYDYEFTVNGAYIEYENGLFIPDKIELKNFNSVVETIDFSDTDKKNYKYMETKDASSLCFMLFKGYSNPASIVKIVDERPINSMNANYATDMDFLLYRVTDNNPAIAKRMISNSIIVSIYGLFNSVPSKKRIVSSIGADDYFIVYGTAENKVKSVSILQKSPEIYCILIIMTLFLAWIWSSKKYSELKVHYDTEDFRKELTSTMAHDLKTPLMAASCYAENLLEGSNPDKNAHYSEGILENIRHMDTIISDVLELSKLESGTSVLSRTRISLKSAAENIRSKYEAIAAERNLTFKITGDAEINADELLVRRALENLITNAVKYADEESDINVHIGRNSFIVENKFSDSGIPSEKEIIKPFVKGDKSRSNKKGSGLGLSIVKNICDMHGFRFKIKISDGFFRAEIVFKK